MEAAAIVFIVLLSTLIACVQLSDLFNNIPEFENPILSFIVVLLMICACWATMNTKKSRTAAAFAFVILSWPIVGLVQDSIFYVRNGFEILIEKENAAKQIGRLLIVTALALAVSPLNTSGAIYTKVPLLLIIVLVCSSCLATPKSPSL